MINENTRSFFFIILFILLGSSPAIASDWVFIGATKELTSYVDKQSIKGDINSRIYWEREVFRNEQKESRSNKFFIEARNLWEINCINNTLKLHDMVHYSINGEIISHRSVSSALESHVVPDTLRDAVKKYVCSFKQTK